MTGLFLGLVLVSVCLERGCGGSVLFFRGFPPFLFPASGCWRVFLWGVFYGFFFFWSSSCRCCGSCRSFGSCVVGSAFPCVLGWRGFSFSAWLVLVFSFCPCLGCGRLCSGGLSGWFFASCVCVCLGF